MVSQTGEVEYIGSRFSGGVLETLPHWQFERSTEFLVVRSNVHWTEHKLISVYHDGVRWKSRSVAFDFGSSGVYRTEVIFSEDGQQFEINRSIIAGSWYPPCEYSKLFFEQYDHVYSYDLEETYALEDEVFVLQHRQIGSWQILTDSDRMEQGHYFDELEANDWAQYCIDSPNG